jgi:hypothetical protein
VHAEEAAIHALEEGDEDRHLHHARGGEDGIGVELGGAAGPEVPHVDAHRPAHLGGEGRELLLERGIALGARGLRVKRRSDEQQGRGRRPIGFGDMCVWSCPPT